MQYQARCNCATKPTPTFKKSNKKPNLTVHKRKKRHPLINLYNQNTFGIYIYSYIIKVIYMASPSIYYLYEQTSFKPKQQHKN